MQPVLIVEERPPAPPTGGLTVGELSVCHDDYDCELWKKLDLLRRGGWEILKQAKDFVPRAPDEGQKLYEWRLKSTSYVNYLAQLVGYLTGGLFQAPITLSPLAPKGAPAAELPDPVFYEAFSRDCDRSGTDFAQFARVRCAEALVFRRAVVALDMPPKVEAANRAQSDELGAGRAYLYCLPLEELINWEKDEFGRFKWAILKREVCDRSSWRQASSGRYRIEWKIWEMTATGAVYSVYRTVEEYDAEREPKHDDAVTPIVEQQLTSFAELPLYELELPEEIWAGNQAGPLCVEHFRRRSDLAGAMCRSLVEIPYIKRGPEIGGVHEALPSDTQQDPNRGADPAAQARAKGWIAVGAGDELAFAGPSGRAFELADKSCDKVRDEIFRTVHAMALALENSDAAVRRSGESKAEDRSALSVVLSFLAVQVREWAIRVYRGVSLARGERVEWQAAGLDKYAGEDRQQRVEEAAEVGGLDIRSRTFHVEYQVETALALVPKLDEAKKQAIRKEIEANIAAEEFSEPPAPPPPPPGAGGGEDEDEEQDEPGEEPGEEEDEDV